jgi:hypothetical protein
LDKESKKIKSGRDRELDPLRGFHIELAGVQCGSFERLLSGAELKGEYSEVRFGLILFSCLMRDEERGLRVVCSFILCTG